MNTLDKGQKILMWIIILAITFGLAALVIFPGNPIHDASTTQKIWGMGLIVFGGLFVWAQDNTRLGNVISIGWAILIALASLIAGFVIMWS